MSVFHAMECVQEEWQEHLERYEQAKRNEARCKGRTDWDRIEQGYVDHGIEPVGEPMTPTRLLGVSDLDDIFAGRPWPMPRAEPGRKRHKCPTHNR